MPSAPAIKAGVLLHERHSGNPFFRLFLHHLFVNFFFLPTQSSLCSLRRLHCLLSSPSLELRSTARPSFVDYSTALRTLTHALDQQKLAVRGDFVPQACSGPNGTGTCTPLNVTLGDGLGSCTNLDFLAKSLILNVDNDCVSTKCVPATPSHRRS
jgi:hypothetical protein